MNNNIDNLSSNNITPMENMNAQIPQDIQAPNTQNFDNLSNNNANSMENMNAQVSQDTQVPNTQIPIAPIGPENVQMSEPPKEIVSNTLTEINNIPTVEQQEQEFIDNAQAISADKTVEEDNSNGINYKFVIVLFIAVLITVFFIFPFITKIKLH